MSFAKDCGVTACVTAGCSCPEHVAMIVTLVHERDVALVRAERAEHKLDSVLSEVRKDVGERDMVSVGLYAQSILDQAAQEPDDEDDEPTLPGRQLS